MALRVASRLIVALLPLVALTACGMERDGDFAEKLARAEAAARRAEKAATSAESAARAAISAKQATSVVEEDVDNADTEDESDGSSPEAEATPASGE